MNVIFLIGFVQALFFIFLILNKQEKSLADGLLVLWIALMGIHVLAVYILFERFLSSPAGIFILLIPPLIYTHGPLLYVYTKMITSGQQKFKSSYLLHFIPFLASVLNYIYLYQFQAQGDLSYFLTRPSITPWTGMFFYLLNMFLNPAYVVVVLFILRDHTKAIRNNFSYTEKISLNWLWVLAFGLGFVSIVVWIIHSLIAAGVMERGFDPEFYIFTAVVIFIFFLGYFGFKQGTIYRYTPEEKAEQHQGKKYQKSSMTSRQAKQLLDALTDHMESNHAYRNSTLSLTMLAEAINTTSYQLSQLLNTYVNKSFFDFVNSYRVKEVQKHIADPAYDHYSLLGIGLEAGFNSKSSFNRIFKQLTGQTPTQYKQQL